MKTIKIQINIRKLKLSNAFSFSNLTTDKELRDNLPYPKRTEYKNDTLKYIQQFIKIANKFWKEKKEYQFGIEDNKTKKAIGFIGLLKLDWKNKKAEVGYWVSKKYRGKGLVKEALNLLLEFAFKELKLKKVHAEVNSLNVSSCKLLEKCGFKLEKRIEKDHKINGKWTNQLFYEIYNEDLQKPKYLYHGSYNKDLKVLIPSEINKRDPKEGAVVFATPDIAFASCFLIGINIEIGAIGSFCKECPWYIVIEDEKKFEKTDKGGAIYILLSNKFHYDKNKGVGYFEWISKKPVKPIRKITFKSALQAMIKNNVQVFFADNKTIQRIKKSKDHGLKNLQGLKSENEKMNKNYIPIKSLLNLKIREPKRSEYKEFAKVENSEAPQYRSIYTPEECDLIHVGKTTEKELTESAKIRKFLIATINNKIIGTMRYYLKDNGVLWVSMLQVLPEYQGKGVGTALFKEVEKIARKLKAKATATEAQKRATWAVAFYKTNGYKILSQVDVNKKPFKGILEKPLSKHSYVFGKVLK